MEPTAKMMNDANNRPGLWVVVPVKPFSEGKSRLATCISPQERRLLNRDLLNRTLAAIDQAHLDAEVLVVSRDSRALAVAKRAGNRTLAEAHDLSPQASPNPESATDGPPPSSGWPNDIGRELRLNAALTQAVVHAAALGASKVLILPTDLPNLTAEDIRNMASSRGGDPQVIIAPSRDGGTNALMLQPAHAIPFSFGPDSFLHHQRLAAEAGIPVRVVKSDSLLFDIDLPEDYEVILTCRDS